MSLGGTVVASLIAVVVIALVIIVLIFNFFKKVQQGQALIINKIKWDNTPRVTFSGGLVIPMIHRAELIDIALKTIVMECRGAAGLMCQDKIRVDVRSSFFIRVKPTAADVLRVAQTLGCEQAARQDTLESLFKAKFTEALNTVSKQFTFEQLYAQRDQFRNQLFEFIGTELNGYVLEQIAIDYLEQTPLTQLDPENIFDAQGIGKITELTAQYHIQTNEFKNQEQMTLTQQDVKAKATILELQRQQADTEAKHARAIRTTQEREQAESAVLAAQERLKSETAQIQTEEKLALYEEHKRRELEIAQQNRARMVAIEAERVKLAQEHERINREQEIELRRIAKEKALETQRQEMAELIQQRLMIERDVAEAEERVQTARLLAEAERQKQITVLQAEAQAQSQLVLERKAAEAHYECTQLKNRTQLALAQAEREAADHWTMAKIRLAEGIQAEQAATGLAEIKVLAEKLRVEAQGEEQKGLAQLRLQRAQMEMLEQRAIAEAKVKEIETTTLEQQGQAQARMLQEKLLAESQGWVERFKVLDTLSERSQAHEEFRLQLEQQLEINKLYLETQKTTVEQQSQILAAALKHAKIDIMSGELFDNILNTTSMAKSFEAFSKHNETTQALLHRQRNQHFFKEIQELLSHPALTTQDFYQLTLVELLNKLMTVSTPEQQQKVQNWLQQLNLDRIDN